MFTETIKDSQLIPGYLNHIGLQLSNNVGQFFTLFGSFHGFILGHELAGACAMDSPSIAYCFVSILAE